MYMFVFILFWCEHFFVRLCVYLCVRIIVERTFLGAFLCVRVFYCGVNNSMCVSVSVCLYSFSSCV